MSAKSSFEITTAADFLKKLEQEFDSLRGDLSSSRHAINFAMTAWHLHEWIWAQLLKGQTALQKKGLGKPCKNLHDFDSSWRTSVPL